MILSGTWSNRPATSSSGLVASVPQVSSSAAGKSRTLNVTMQSAAAWIAGARTWRSLGSGSERSSIRSSCPVTEAPGSASFIKLRMRSRSSFVMSWIVRPGVPHPLLVDPFGPVGLDNLPESEPHQKIPRFEPGAGNSPSTFSGRPIASASSSTRAIPSRSVNRSLLLASGNGRIYQSGVELSNPGLTA